MFLEHKEEFDFSTNPFEHECHDPSNKKVIGKMKDELNSLILEDFIALLPKCKSLWFHGEVENNVVKHLDVKSCVTAKGTRKSVRKRHIRHKHFQGVLDNLNTIYVKQNTLKSSNHSISSYHQTKVSLTGFDTKRWIMDDGIHTLAYGHCNARE